MIRKIMGREDSTTRWPVARLTLPSSAGCSDAEQIVRKPNKKKRGITPPKEAAAPPYTEKIASASISCAFYLNKGDGVVAKTDQKPISTPRQAAASN